MSIPPEARQKVQRTLSAYRSHQLSIQELNELEEKSPIHSLLEPKYCLLFSCCLNPQVQAFYRVTGSLRSLRRFYEDYLIVPRMLEKYPGSVSDHESTLIGSGPQLLLPRSWYQLAQKEGLKGIEQKLKEEKEIFEEEISRLQEQQLFREKKLEKLHDLLKMLRGMEKQYDSPTKTASEGLSQRDYHCLMDSFASASVDEMHEFYLQIIRILFFAQADLPLEEKLHYDLRRLARDQEEEVQVIGRKQELIREKIEKGEALVEYLEKASPTFPVHQREHRKQIERLTRQQEDDYIFPPYQTPELVTLLLEQIYRE